MQILPSLEHPLYYPHPPPLSSPFKRSLLLPSPLPREGGGEQLNRAFTGNMFLQLSSCVSLNNHYTRFQTKISKPRLKGCASPSPPPSHHLRIDLHEGVETGSTNKSVYSFNDDDDDDDNNNDVTTMIIINYDIETITWAFLVLVQRKIQDKLPIWRTTHRPGKEKHIC